MAKTGIIFAINGPIVKTSNDSGFEMHEGNRSYNRRNYY